jgi:2-methylcitrate dehydratase PrpD
MVSRSRFYADPEFDKRGEQETLQAKLVEGNLIKIYRRDGTVVTGKSGFAKGSPENPMTYEEVADKFRSNAEFAKWPKKKTESVIEMTKTLEALPDLSKLTTALTT